MEIEEVPVGVEVVGPLLVVKTDMVTVRLPGVAPLVFSVAEPIEVVEVPLLETVVKTVVVETASSKFALMVPDPPIIA
jgi:hypothetical protein